MTVRPFAKLAAAKPALDRKVLPPLGDRARRDVPGTCSGPR